MAKRVKYYTHYLRTGMCHHLETNIVFPPPWPYFIHLRCALNLPIYIDHGTCGRGNHALMPNLKETLVKSVCWDHVSQRLLWISTCLFTSCFPVSSLSCHFLLGKYCPTHLSILWFFWVLWKSLNGWYQSVFCLPVSCSLSHFVFPSSYDLSLLRGKF